MSPGARAALPATLPAEWRETARLFREHEERSVARAYEKCAGALEDALREVHQSPLTLAEAAQLSGYSAEHLGRLVRQGKIPNAGRPGAPRIARKDAPVKAGTVAASGQEREIDIKQIVRSAITEGAA